MPSIRNPFPGPQPYRAEDREVFFGRGEAALALADTILSHRFLTMYGPSGAGKSSLLQAAIVPDLVRDWDLRVAFIDAWPPQEILETGPVARLAGCICDQLGLGPSESPDIDRSLGLAFRRSERPVLIVLDQIEQLLVHHDIEVLRDFVGSLVHLEGLHKVAMHVVVCLREDYLGRWTDLLKDHPRLTQHTFRLKRLSAVEITPAVIQAAGRGDPPQTWRLEETRALVDQMAVPGQWLSDTREVESAYVQIVCRALFGMGGPEHAVERSADQILERYLEDTLGGLGNLEGPARRLLEKRLITRSGARVPVTRAAAQEEIGNETDAGRILEHLEQARILRALQHEGDRLFELGHDWLARPIQESASRQRKREADRRMRSIRIIVGLAFLAVCSLGAYFFDLYRKTDLALDDAEVARTEAENQRLNAERSQGEAVQQGMLAENRRQEAESQTVLAEERRLAAEAATQAAESARQIAENERLRADQALGEVDAQRNLAEETAQLARDAARMLAVRELEDDPELALPFLREVARPQDLPDPLAWMAAAWRFLQQPPSLLTTRLFRLSSGLSVTNVSSPDSEVLALAMPDGRVRVLDPLHPAHILELVGHEGRVSGLATCKGKDLLLSGSMDRTARFWIRSTGAPLDLLTTHDAPVTALALDPGCNLAATGSKDGHVRTWDISAEGPPVLLDERTQGGTIWSLAFDSRGRNLLVASEDGIVSVRDPRGSGVMTFPPPGVQGPRTVLGAAFDRGDPRQVIIASATDAWIWDTASNSTQLLGGHVGYVVRAVSSPAGARRILTLTSDGEARLFTVAPGHSSVSDPVPLWQDHGSLVSEVAFSPDGESVVTGSSDGSLTLWRVSPDGRILSRRPLVGHRVEILLVAFTRGGQGIVSMDASGELRRWDAVVPPLSRVLPGIDGRTVKVLGFAADGAKTGAKARDGSVLAWDLNGQTMPSAADIDWGTVGTDSQTIPPLLEHAGSVGSLVIDPTGSHLVTASDDGTVRLWPLLSIPELQARLDSLPVSCISAEHRMTYLGEGRAQAEQVWQECEARRKSGSP